MAAHHVDALAALGLLAGQCGDDVHDVGGLRYARARVDHVLVECDLQAAARIAGTGVELGLDPAPRRADAARLRGGIGERIARAEGSELANPRFDPDSGDLGDDGCDARVRISRSCVRLPAREKYEGYRNAGFHD